MVTAFLFALIYKVLPDVRIRWRDVLIGGSVTALLFSLGRFLIGLYLGKSSVGSAFGAAGSLVIILLWVYYSAPNSFFRGGIHRGLRQPLRFSPAADAQCGTCGGEGPINLDPRREECSFPPGRGLGTQAGEVGPKERGKNRLASCRGTTVFPWFIWVFS